MLEPRWVGRRVTVRRIVERRPDGRLLQGDVVGDLLDLDDQTAVVETRNGVVEVPVALITAAKTAPPSTFDELALEAIATRGWQARETAMIGGWLLRADGGFTGRANSVLPLRAPGVPLQEALDAAAAWYAERSQPLRIACLPEARRLLDAELAERSWPLSKETHVLAARLDRLARLPEPDLRVTHAAAPTDAWLDRYRGNDTRAQALLTRHLQVTFASITDGNELVAIGRGVVDDGWLGVAAVEVAPRVRRQGLATAVMDALWRWGTEHGAKRTYLQVSMDNAPALALHEGLGYWRHHDYWYRRPPEPGLSAA